MEGIKVTGKDVIIHRDLTPEEREEELKRLKKESDNLKEWEDQIPLIIMTGGIFVLIFRKAGDVFD